MILMPLSGYLGTGVDIEFFSLFNIPAFKDTALFTGLIGQQVSYEAFERPIDIFHKEIMGEWLVWLLILGHDSAAIYHHFAVGARTLRKMTTGRYDEVSLVPANSKNAGTSVQSGVPLDLGKGKKAAGAPPTRHLCNRLHRL